MQPACWGLYGCNQDLSLAATQPGSRGWQVSLYKELASSFLGSQSVTTIDHRCHCIKRPPPLSRVPEGDHYRWVSLYVIDWCVCVRPPLCRDELKTLETKLTQAKQRYQHTLSQAQAQGESSDAVSALPHFEVHDRFLLNQDEAWYTLSIEIQVPIDHIMLQVREGEGEGEWVQSGHLLSVWELPG